jgi:hypothetical protein
MNALGRVALVTLATALFASAILAVPFFTGTGAAGRTRHGGGAKRAGALPDHIYVCRNPFYAPRALGGEECYANEADVGTTPVASPKALMCETSLTGVEHKVISIQVLHKRRRIVDWHARSSSRSAEPYVTFDRSGIITGYPDDEGTGLQPGRYRCQFLVNGKVARARDISVSGKLDAH